MTLEHQRREKLRFEREVIAKEFYSKVYLSKGRESSICVIDDIVDSVEFHEPVIKSTKIEMAQIVAVQELNKYRSCFSCKTKVEPVQGGLQDDVQKKTAKCFKNMMFVLSNYKQN